MSDHLKVWRMTETPLWAWALSWQARYLALPTKTSSDTTPRNRSLRCERSLPQAPVGSGADGLVGGVPGGPVGGGGQVTIPGTGMQRSSADAEDGVPSSIAPIAASTISGSKRSVFLRISLAIQLPCSSFLP